MDHLIVMVGGKDGGEWAHAFPNSSVSQWWSSSLSDKITEISGINTDDDGREEALIGDDSGKVAVFTETGGRNNLESHNTGITRIDVGRLNSDKYVVIADGTEVEVHKVNFTSMSELWWHT
ncbi:MAG TPA: hypothetical protein VJ022_11510 [Anaerolineales bacterium]|nr:hypothetical protein [Anaerolineales bacterium]